MLYQRAGVDQKLHPCPIFSCQVSSAERNDNICNHELLAIKLALEERWHWLELTKLLFLVWTDNKNLDYICSAKHLNSHQVGWALFFIRFNFTLSYCPGSRNIKLDALSRKFVKGEESTKGPETSLPLHSTWCCGLNVLGERGHDTWWKPFFLHYVLWPRSLGTSGRRTGLQPLDNLDPMLAWTAASMFLRA